MTLKDQVLNVMAKHDVIAVDLTLVNLTKVNGGGYIVGYKPGIAVEESIQIYEEVNALVNTPDVEEGDEEWVCTTMLNTKNPDIPDRYLRKGRDY